MKRTKDNMFKDAFSVFLEGSLWFDNQSDIDAFWISLIWACRGKAHGHNDFHVIELLQNTAKLLVSALTERT